MSCPKIGFDIDGSFIDTYTLFVEVINATHEMGISVEDLKAGSLEISLGLSQESIREAFDQAIVAQWKELRPYAGAVNCLQTVAVLQGGKLPFITARPTSQRSATQKLLNLHLGNAKHEVHLVGGGTAKSELAKGLGITHFVEDCADTANELARSGIDCFLLSRPWNEGIGLDKGIVVVRKGWRELAEHLSALLEPPRLSA